MTTSTKDKNAGRALQHLVPCVLLGCLVILSYANTLTADFVYDDHIALVENLPLRSLRNIPQFFSDPAHTSASVIFEEIYRPVRATVFAVEYQMWGLNPIGFHAMNLAFHFLNTLLVFLLLKRISATHMPALAGALLFAAHPALTENVSWICSRSDLLCMFFYLASVLCYLKSRERTGRGRWTLYGASIFGAFGAMFSKEMGVTFPLVIVAIDVWSDGVKHSLKRWTAYLPFFAAAGVYMVIRTSLVSQFAQREPWGDTPLETVGIMARGFLYYFRLLVFPFNLTVLPHINPHVPPHDPRTVAAIAAIFILLAGGILSRRKFPLASLGVVLFFLLLLPASNIVPIKAIVGDRFIYVPSIGFFIVATAFVRHVDRSASEKPLIRVLLGGGIAVVIFILSVNTIVRNTDWKNNFSLFHAAAQVTPNYPRARTALGWEYLLREEYEEASGEARAALNVDPGYKEAHVLLGALYFKQGLLNPAERELNLVLQVDPENAHARNTLGMIYESQGKLDEALAMFESVLENNPVVSEYLNNVGVVLLKKGDFASAADYFERAFEAKAENLDAGRNLAYARIEMGKYEDAINLLLDLVSQYPGDLESLLLLGRAYTEAGNYSSAIRAYRRAVDVAPSDTRAPTALANLYIDMGDSEKAISICRNILKRYPGSAEHRVMLAAALENLGRIDAAITELEVAVKLKPADQSLRSKLSRLQSLRTEKKPSGRNGQPSNG